MSKTSTKIDSSSGTSLSSCPCGKQGFQIDLQKELKHFTTNEVVVHNKQDDIWVIIHGWVLNLTDLFEKRRCSMNDNMSYLLRFGGKDLSHFFHGYGIPKTRLSPRGNTLPIFPPIVEQTDAYDASPDQHLWWHDPQFIIGKITRQERKVRIINMLSATTQSMTVCEEDTLNDIQAKYKRYNWHQESYDWKRYDTTRRVYLELDMNKTLTENGLPYDPYRAPPALWLRYKDDGTVA